MRKPAGEFKWRLEWNANGLGTSSTTGEKGRAYSVRGFLWCAIEERSAGTQTFLESTQAEHRATIIVRGKIYVQPEDLLIYYGDVNETWTVEAVRHDDVDTFCEATR